MGLTESKPSDLNFNPWGNKEKAADLRANARLNAIVARHYLGMIVLERVDEETGVPIYVSRMPEWWLKDLPDAEGMTAGIPPYSWLDMEALTDAMMLLDFAADYEISTNFGGTEVDVRVWFKAAPGTKRAEERERTMGWGRASEHDFPQAVRPYGHMRASQILGLSICRAVLDAIHEMDDQEYEIHLSNVRRSIINFIKDRQGALL